MLKEASQKIKQDMVAWRRDFHRYPELSFTESRTAKVISAFLKDCGLKVRENVNGHGVIGDLFGKRPGPTIALRADMDALPIMEESGVTFASLVPGAFCFIGAGDTTKPVYLHHHPRFQIDEAALPLATEWLCRMASKYVFDKDEKSA
jgi:metal-dependent amidase/aminoacylase/carboxypeptidase family protein